VSGANVCRLLALTGLSALLWVVPPAQAEPDTVTTLTGEVLQFHFSGASLNCQDTNNGTFTYESDAIVQSAAGPYPGTMHESGTLVFEDGLSKTFHATFTIDSAAGHVEGTKTLSFPDTTVCTTIGSGPGEIQQIQPNMQLRYEATITTPAGTLQDRGSVSAPMVANLSATGTIGNMSESFASDRDVNDLDLTPKESVNAPGTNHTVTALFRDAALVPQSGETILFTVSGSSAETGQCTTGSDGTCTFTYQGPAVPGADLIEGCHDFDGDGTTDPGEKCDTATKAWGESASTGEGASGGGYFNNNVNGNRVVFGFGAHGGPVTPSGSCQLMEQAAGVTVRCLSVTLLLIAGTHATIGGEALVNGVATNYQIDVEDLADPGAAVDTFTIVTDAGYAASGVVEHGNIQVNSG